MNFFPEFSVSLLNGFLLMIPLFLIRFLLPYLINSDSLPKLQFFPEVIGKEKTAIKVYFVTNTFLIFSPLFSPITNVTWYGMTIYILGLLFCILSIANFSSEEGFVNKGVYAISRNPMYIGYFGIFIGTAIMISSIMHLIIALIYQISVHYLILSEERWCKGQFGNRYEEYINKVPRYIIF